MVLYLRYIRERLLLLVQACLLPGLTVLMGWLWGAETAELAYAAALELVLMLAISLIGFVRYRARHIRLKQTAEQILLDGAYMPPPADIIEEDYQQLLDTALRRQAAAQSAAEHRYSQMEDYFTLWAHQIKTPISAMRLIIQSEQERYGGEVENELFRIEQYVEMALGYMRLDSDYSDFVLESCSLDEIIKQTLRKLSRQFIGRRISLHYEETMLHPVTDEKWLCFVIEQLLTNALKYTAEGGTVSICAEGSRLIIQDSGIGIAPEDMPLVFNKGYTGYNGRADKKSTGIGLYLCKWALDRLGHAIELESAPGEGTRVSIELGREKQTQPAQNMI